MPPSNKLIHRFAEVEVSLGERTVTAAGQPLHLRPRTFQVLEYLIEQRHRLVSKQELLELFWRDTAVSDNSPAQCVIELRKALGDDARTPRFIKTVSKVGYQFIGTLDPDEAIVETAEPPVELPATREPVQSPRSLLNTRRWLAAAALAILALIAIAIRPWTSVHTETIIPEVPGKTPVIVFYFQNETNSPDLDWMRAGLADMLITTLSRSPKLSVLSRAQLDVKLAGSGRSGALTLKQAQDTAISSHASSLVLGEFVRIGQSISIHAQLHDARTGRLLASESVTSDDPSRIPAQAETLALELAADVGAPLTARAANNGLAAARTSNLEAYRDYSLGLEQAKELHEDEAIALFQKAVSLDPNFAMAQARIGYTLAITGVRTAEGRPYLAKAFAQSPHLTDSDRRHIAAWYAIASFDYEQAIQRYRELIAADSSETESYLRLGLLLQGEQRYQESIEVLQQGLTWDRDSASLLNVLASDYTTLGRHAEAIKTVQRRVELSPSEANAHDSLGLTYFWAGRYHEAEAAFRTAMELNPRLEFICRHLANLYIQTGRYHAALDLLNDDLARFPNSPLRGTVDGTKAMIFLRQGSLDSALQASQTAGMDVRALVWLRKGDASRAADTLSKMPDPWWTARGQRPAVQRFRTYMKGELAMLENRPEDAIAKFKEALNYRFQVSDPDSFEDCLADAYLKLGRLDDAIAEYRRILNLFPGLAQARFHLATALDRKGARDQARTEYQQFQQLWVNADEDRPELAIARKALQN